MIPTVATLTYDYPPMIVAPVGLPQRSTPRVRYFVPPDTHSATTDDTEFTIHLTKLKAIAVDPSLWPEDAEPPSEFSIAWAQLVVQEFQMGGLLPTRVVASAEGGVGVCFVAGDKYADIECLNSGVILGVLSNKRDRPTVWEVEQDARGLARASERIRKFIESSAAKTNASERSAR